MSPDSISIQDKILKASIAGDTKLVTKLRTDLAYADLPEQFLLEYHRARMAFKEAGRAFDEVKSKIPEYIGIKQNVIDMLERNSDRLKALHIN